MIHHFKSRHSITRFSLLMGFFNFLIFHLPFFAFVTSSIDYSSVSGIGLILSFVILTNLANAFAFYLLLSLPTHLGKILLMLFFILNAAALYFVNTYNIIVDDTTMKNVLNTNYEESSAFFSYKLMLYIVLLGLLPSLYIIKAQIIKDSARTFLVKTSLTLLFMIAVVFANGKQLLWIDKNSRTLGGLVMPWSYIVNTSLNYIEEYKKNKKEILLPDATIQDSVKSLVVLVLGESARSRNFSLYGYPKNTNPLLSQTPDLFWFKANAGATYTTAGLKCILEHTPTSELYEILPNYLYRNHVEVFWRTTNWGEPPLHIKHYQSKEELSRLYQGDSCAQDQILLTGLKDQIASSNHNKILVVLHTSTSHGPSYSEKYPPKFELFKPTCKSVELGKCATDELINAYDNTIVYTDYLLASVIETLKELKSYNSTLIFVSDHGESLGENNLYMHGLPLSIAPPEQYEIPFIVWLSNRNFREVKPYPTLNQGHVFHSVLNFLGIQSPVYNEELNIFTPPRKPVNQADSTTVKSGF